MFIKMIQNVKLCSEPTSFLDFAEKLTLRTLLVPVCGSIHRIHQLPAGPGLFECVFGHVCLRLDVYVVDLWLNFWLNSVPQFLPCPFSRVTSQPCRDG